MKYNFLQMTKTAKLPTRHTAESAGVDFYSDQTLIIPPKQSRKVSTGVSWNPSWFPISFQNGGWLESFNISLIIQSRSGYAFKFNIEASNAGVIDQDYTPQGEEKAIINVLLYNHGHESFIVKQGDKICQGVPNLVPYFDDVENLDESRGGKGFGSSDDKEPK